MANYNMIDNLSKRLNVDDEYTIKKCQEFLRILQTKNTLKLSEQVQVIICLDLATVITGTSFDKETALQLCPLKKSAYNNIYNNIRKILNLDRPLTINELCVKFSCTHLKEVAEKLFNSYKKKNPQIEEVEHPQYVAASVYTVCKLNNLKPPKSEFTSLSRLKPTQWATIANEFEQFAITAQSKKKLELDEILSHKESTTSSRKEKDEQKNTELEHEDYEVWKERILRIARESIKNGMK